MEKEFNKIICLPTTFIRLIDQQRSLREARWTFQEDNPDNTLEEVIGFRREELLDTDGAILCSQFILKVIQPTGHNQMPQLLEELEY